MAVFIRIKRKMIKLIFVTLFAVLAVHGAPNKFKGLDFFDVLGQLEDPQSQEKETQFEVCLKLFNKVTFE